MWNNGIAVGQAFDTGSSSPALQRLIDSGEIPQGRALVPGCGRGYDVWALASPNREVVGLELSEKAAESALGCPTKGACLAPENVKILNENFFDHEQKYDFIYDYTFLCALDPSIRPDWASKMAALVKPGGLLLTLIFPITKEEKIGGPPFQMSLELVESLLAPVGFRKEELGLLPPELCHKGRGDGSDGPFNAVSGIGRWIRL